MFSVVSSGERDQTGQDAGFFFVCLFVFVWLFLETGGKGKKEKDR